MKNNAKVYFTDFHATYEENLLQKLKRLIKAAGIEDINFRKQFVAIKIHFGELGNLAFIQPNYAKVVVDIIKENAGLPFLTDCNTLYVGKRTNALEHIDTAYENGFSPFSTGCNVIIADGLKGTDEARITINGDYVKEAKIGQAIKDADIIISMNHFKAHEQTGIGGALKNLGMGCGSRAGKMEMHSAGKPYIFKERCIGCAACMKQCAHSAIRFDEQKKAQINHNKCVGCGRCIGVCPEHAVQSASDESVDILNKKIAEYTLAVLKDKPHFHITFINKVSPYCDCHAENDIPIVPDIGMLASFDPVALDKACADLVNAQKPMPKSLLDGLEGDDHFIAIHPTTDWKVGIDHAEKLGIGSSDYELVAI